MTSAPTVTKDVGHIDISWSSVTGATYYHVYKSSNKYWDYTELGSSSTTTYIWNSPSNGTWYIRIEADGNGGKGGFSPSTSVTWP